MYPSRHPKKEVVNQANVRIAMVVALKRRMKTKTKHLHKVHKIQRTSAYGSLRSMESIQAAPALPTPKYSSNHIRDRRTSVTHARPAAHNERAGDYKSMI